MTASLGAGEAFDGFAEEIIAGHNDQVVVDFFFVENEVDVADGAEFVGIVGRTVVDDFEIQFGFFGAIVVSPFLKMVGELGVGDEVNAVHADGGDVVDDVFDHRLACDR